MEVHHTVSSFKILLIMVLLLFWVGCVADTVFLKAPEKQHPQDAIARESKEKPSQVLPDERNVPSNGVELAKPLLSGPDPQRTIAGP